MCPWQGCQPTTSSNIENWWLGDDKWRHNAHGMWHHLWKKNAQKRCFWKYCNIWPNCLTSHQSHYCLHYNRILKFVRKRSLLTVKYLKQRKVLEISLPESRFLKKWQTSAIIQEISDSNLEDVEKRFKIWSVLDYLGELTALPWQKHDSGLSEKLQSVNNLTIQTFAPQFISQEGISPPGLSK